MENKYEKKAKDGKCPDLALTDEEQILVDEYIDKTDAMVTFEDGEWKVSVPEDTYTYKYKEDMMLDIRYNLNEIAKEESSAPSADAGEIEMEQQNIITEVYSVGNGFFVDVTVTPDWQDNGLVREAWLYHRSIGIKEMVFGVLVKSTSRDEFLETLKANLYDGNCFIEGYRETYMDSFCDYQEWKERA